MKNKSNVLFHKYIFPPLYGILIYFTVRLLHDTDVGLRFWTRDFFINFIEIFFSILVGIASILSFRKILNYYDNKYSLGIDFNHIAKELFSIVLVALSIACMIFIPMNISLRKDSIPIADIVDITIIPTLYSIIYYGISRSQKWLQGFVNQKLEIEKNKNVQTLTELKFLKAQYHPHFLFNALNTIYFQMDDDIIGAKKTVEIFSDLLRYQLYNPDILVPIEKEIQYIRSYVQLQKLRLPERFSLVINFADHLHDEKIYPLLFLPLIENAFKYVAGSLMIDMQMIKIGDWIEFSINNSIDGSIDTNDNNRGIGLENLRRRLELIYPNKHSFVIDSDNKCFHANLKLNYV